MLEIEIHEDAENELKAAATFYEERERDLGLSFLRRLRQTFDDIITQPYAGTIVVNDIRRRLLRQFPYSVVYRIESQRIVVLAVAHWSREPGYWKQRAKE
jgi:plasmid stabilization system protein ParE